MKLSSIFSILIFSSVSFFSFLIFRLNQTEVPFDILFKEIQTKLGILILSSFLAGFIICILLEFIYFYRKKKE